MISKNTDIRFQNINNIKKHIMKTVISSTGNEPNSLFDLRFGRAGWFCVYDDANGEVEFFENEHANAQGGAGTKAAEKMVELGQSEPIRAQLSS